MSADASDSAAASSRFGVGIARAFAGALIFALPMLMTMELWHLGFYMDRYRPVLLMIVAFPMLVGRSEEHTSELQSLMRISYAVFCLKKQKPINITYIHTYTPTT